MKKFLLMAVVAFGMLATACSKDEVAQPVVGGEESIVTFTVEAPVMVTRAHGDGLTATDLTVLVYQRGGDLLFEKEAEMVGLKATVELPFVNGMEYDLVFWAEAENSPYDLNRANKSVTYTDAAALVGNSEAYDAFYAYVNDIPEITGPVTRKVELKRPFAQLNIITNDAADAAKSDLVVKDVKVVVKKGYTAFDFVTGNGINQGAVTFGAVAKQSDTTLAVNYLFTGGEKSLVDVEFTYTDVNNKLGTAGLTKEYAAVPVQRNYRTNIVGSLLTSEGEFDIEINPDFNEPENTVSDKVATAEELLNAVAAGLDNITLTADITLSEPLNITKDLIIDGNGKTLSVSQQYAIVACPNAAGEDKRIDVALKNINIDAERTGNNGYVIAAGNANLTLGEGVVINAEGYSCVVEASVNDALTNPSLVTIDGANLSLVNTVAPNGTVIGAGYGSTIEVKSGVIDGSACNYAVSAYPTGGTVHIRGGEIIGALKVYDAYNPTEKPTVINVYNGTFNTDPSAYVAAGYMAVNNGDGTWSVVDADAVDSAAALSAALAAGGEIALSADITAGTTIEIPEGVEVILHLNGKTLSGAIAKTDGPILKNKGTLTIKGGTISSTAKNGGSAIQNNAGAELTINDVTINGAEFEAPGWPSYGINNYGTLTINDADITTYHGAVATGGDGVTVINDATVDVGNSTETNQTSWALYVYDNGQLTVNGGTFANTKNEYGQVYGGGYICTIGTNQTIINGGTFDKTEGDNNGSGFYYNNQNLVIKGGTFDADPSAYVANGYKAVENNGTWTIEMTKVGEILKQIEEHEGAITITLEEALTFEGGETFNIPAGKTVTLNLNGKEIVSASADAFVAQAGATLTISGNGTVKSNGAPIRTIGGEVIVEGGTFTQTGAWNTATSTYRYSIDSREGGEVIIKGGTFNTNNGLINVDAGSSVVIDGGEFTFDNNTGGTRHFAYVSGDLTINDGVFRGVADSGAGGCFFCGAASTCNIQVNGGKFTSLWTSGSVNKIFESYYGGTINVTGGLFNTDGGITSFVEANTDPATMAEYPYKAK
ncbi:MAG: hypothetical protein IJB39_01595 [Alistipes sp.]|nr:hypothetical protein [Alistipes sp.]